MAATSPRACSGLMYCRVPLITPTSETRVAATSESVIRARPKSRILTIGPVALGPLPVDDAASSATMMFEGLRSRWMTPRWWA